VGYAGYYSADWRSGWGNKGINILDESGNSRGGDLKLDESCISNPKSENIRLDRLSRRHLNLVVSSRVMPVQFEVSDFGFEMQDSSNFQISI
jgi:hypothetical protein